MFMLGPSNFYVISVSLEYKNSNGEEALVLAASRVTSTCINAAIAFKVSRFICHFYVSDP